jgi:hypothetical protein
MPPAPSALSRLREIGPVFRSKDAVAAGVSWRDLYALRDRGEILELSRGLYRLSGAAGIAGGPTAAPVPLVAAPRGRDHRGRRCGDPHRTRKAAMTPVTAVTTCPVRTRLASSPAWPATCAARQTQIIRLCAKAGGSAYTPTAMHDGGCALAAVY